MTLKRAAGSINVGSCLFDCSQDIDGSSMTGPHSFLCRQLTDCEGFATCNRLNGTWVQCIANNALAMDEACLNSMAPVLNLQAVDVVASASAWTAIQQACGAIANEVCT